MMGGFFSSIAWIQAGAVWADQATEVPSYGGELVKTVIALIIVCVLAYVLLRWGLGWLYGKKPLPNHMKILGRLPIEGRRSLYLVRVQSRTLLLGVTDSSVALLAELDSEEFDRQAEKTQAGAARAGRSFQQVLSRILVPNQQHAAAKAEGTPEAERSQVTNQTSDDNRDAEPEAEATSQDKASQRPAGTQDERPSSREKTEDGS